MSCGNDFEYLQVHSRDAERPTRQWQTLGSEGAAAINTSFWRSNTGPDRWHVGTYYHTAGERSAKDRHATVSLDSQEKITVWEPWVMKVHRLTMVGKLDPYKRAAKCVIAAPLPP